MKTKVIAKIVSILGICFLFHSEGFTQARFGFRIGANISNQEFKRGSLTVEPKSKFGLDLAIVADFPLGEVVSFGPELHWLQKGFKVEDFEYQPGQFLSITSTLNYLELPLLIKFNFGEEAKFHVMGGPSFGYLLSDKTEDGDGNELEFEDLIEEINRIELGAHFGAGFSVRPVVIDVRYILGISNVANDVPDVEVRNNAFGAGVSFLF